MGWTQYDRSMSRDEALLEMRSLHDWKASDGTKYTVLQDGITGHGDCMGYYAAVRETDPDGSTRTFCAVNLITLCPFGYKGMTEDDGPRISDPPRRVLEALEPLPARDPQPCRSCEGTGALHGERYNEAAQGRDCFSCKGTGEKDRFDHARAWRKKAWSRFGGEPHGQQLDLLAS